ncbi:hypothetical protein Cci01nite_61760 [Catellatospora citrea]|uniref:Uncharacterized protein n=1 Tax=Catellatospora citrea TaxID=53366 RepID=A0A8J3P2D5_9ACTN|nr:hypothetical protein C8E86_1109 [Catellatospora citrea]GIG01083.1 hypothetical protein Cci01nite_61760 [Catellatospora citrea]
MVADSDSLVGAVTALAGCVGVPVPADPADEHQRGRLYLLAMDRPECHGRLLAAAAADPVLMMTVVVAMLAVDREGRDRWVALAREKTDRAYASRRAAEHTILEACGDVPGLGPELLATWSDWLQRCLSEGSTVPAVLDLLARHGRTRRIRNTASSRIGAPPVRVSRSRQEVVTRCVEHVGTAYRSPVAPNRSFVTAAVDRLPYRDLCHELAALGRVADDTDVNCDVSFTLVLHGPEPLMVRLSMVGPYAAVLHVGDAPASGRLLLPRRRGNSETAQHVLHLLTRHGLILLDEGELATRVPLALTGPGTDATLYAALFEPGADLPWLR